MFLRISRQDILLTYNMITVALEMGEWQLIIVKDTLKSSAIRIKNGTFPFFRANKW